MDAGSGVRRATRQAVTGHGHRGVAPGGNFNDADQRHGSGRYHERGQAVALVHDGRYAHGAVVVTDLVMVVTMPEQGGGDEYLGRQTDPRQPRV
jgi:hypothetical protein